MSVKLTINDFNRVVAPIELVALRTNEPMNTVLFVSTLENIDLQALSGSITKEELQNLISTDTDMIEKIDISLSQKTNRGADIKPETFYIVGKVFAAIPGSPTTQEEDDFKAFLNQNIFDVVSGDQKQFVCSVYSDISDFTETYLQSLDSLHSDWNCISILEGSDVLTETLQDAFSNTYVVYPYQTGASTFESYSDGAWAGRIIYMGVGNTQGVAKELVGITTYKLGFSGGEEAQGRLTTTEAAAIRDEGYNIYTQYVNEYNETSGLQLPSGDDFTYWWALYKTAADISQNLQILRHDEEVLTTSPSDEYTVRAEIVSTMENLKLPKEAGGQGVIYDYEVINVPQNRSLANEEGLFRFKVNVSLFQEGKWFEIGITGYRDGRNFTVEVA